MVAKKLSVCQVGSEMVPFAKTGGLADVVGALSSALKKEKVNVITFLPLYKQVKENISDLVSTNLEVSVRIMDETFSGRVWKTKLDNVEVYFIQRDEYYHREYLYSTPQGDYADNASRFIFFSRAVLEAIKLLGLKFDIIHCHDWQTALIPVYLKSPLYKKEPVFANVKTVTTVHNLAYQGVFWHWDMKLTGLGWEYFNYKQLEFHSKMNFLKGGLVFADKLNTVSPRYAQEIQTPQYGERLDGVLRERSKDLSGIINGVDYSLWNPATDKLIPARYDVQKLADKSKNKRGLQARCNLTQADKPLIGLIGRLAGQKGLDILVEIFDEMIKAGYQFVLLGTGEEKYHHLLREIAGRFPGDVSVNITFDNVLAHMITAGADMLLMPSRYEPCGLNQLYALKYGTIPIVHETGGLADTIENYMVATIPGGTGENIRTATGFNFKNYTAVDLFNAIKYALACYKDKKVWRQLMKNAMTQDWSWKHSAGEYIRLYRGLRG
ncbi:MAG: glycogen synthase GlgA [Planctomycetota bacterium]|nr:glycogen synthase GlgA [Planctomycetota bacterium]MDI6788055.1 glycogen synthase GlgA [Planctomycetota bacterium]